MHYFGSVIILINQKSKYLFISLKEKMTILKKNGTYNKSTLKKGFDFALQYVNSNTEQRSGNLTFRKGTTYT